MSEYIFLPVLSSSNKEYGKYFAENDGIEHKKLDLAFPIDKIREIKDISTAESLIKGKEQTYCDECLTEIIMESGDHYVVNVRATAIVDKINELEGVEKKKIK